MRGSSKIEIEKFKGQNFEHWKFKMENLLVDREQWVVGNPRTTPIGMSKEDWQKIDEKARSTIQICLADSVLQNVSKEDTAKKLWEKLRYLYQSK